MNARTHLANAVPSILWTTVFIVPAYIFCAHHLELRSIYAFSVAGAVFMVLPKAFMRRLALSSNAAAYRRLQVPILMRITQDAGWIRRMSGNSASRARRDRKALAQIERDTWARERFHLGLLVFYGLCSIVALLHALPLWCFALVVLNIFYNLYPIWLQQYLRLRVLRCQGRNLLLELQSL